VALVKKRWWKSKTLWVNAVFAATTIAEANLGLLQGALGPKSYLGVMGAMAFVNCILRVITTQPIAGGGK
jgi:hypothetical protein